MPSKFIKLDIPGPGEHPLILGWPALFKPKSFVEKGQTNQTSPPRYSAIFLMSPQHPAVVRIKQAIDEVARAEFPQVCTQQDANGFVVFPPFGFSTPLKWGDEYANEQGKSAKRQALRGYWVLSAGAPSVMKDGSQRKPPSLTVVDHGLAVNLPFDATRAPYEDSHFYGGAHVLATVNITEFTHGSNRGITAYLNCVVSLGTGDRVPDLCATEGVDGTKHAAIAQHIGTVQPQGSPYANAVPIGAHPTSAPAHPGFGPR